jgi:hypothetical protein
MLYTIFKNINNLAMRFFNFVTNINVNNNVLLNNDVESCCLINDDTTTYSE